MRSQISILRSKQLFWTVLLTILLTLVIVISGWSQNGTEEAPPDTIRVSATPAMADQPVYKVPASLPDIEWERLFSPPPVEPIEITPKPPVPTTPIDENAAEEFDLHAEEFDLHVVYPTGKEPPLDDPSTIISTSSWYPKTSRGENNHYYAVVRVSGGGYPYPWLKIYKCTGNPASSSWTHVIGIYSSSSSMEFADIECVSSNNRCHVIYKLGSSTISSFWFLLSSPNTNDFVIVESGASSPAYCSITSDEVEYYGSGVFLYACWKEESSVKFKRSTDSGQNWTDETTVVSSGAYYMLTGNSIAYCPGDNHVFIVYTNTSYDVRVAESSQDRGLGSYSSTTVMSSSSVPYTSCGIVSMYSNCILVTAHGAMTGSDLDVMFVYSSNAGSSWFGIYYFDQSYDQTYPSCTANDNGYFSILHYDADDTRMRSKRNVYSNMPAGNWSVGTVDDDHYYNGVNNACMEDGSSQDHGGAWSTGNTSSATSYFGWAGEEPGHLTWSPTSHDFGDVIVGQTSSPFTFTLTNDGGQSVSGIVSLTGTYANQYQITSGGGNFTLSPNQTRDVTVVFSPISSGNKPANLHASGANAPDAGLSGNGVEIGHLTWSPTSHDFGDVIVGQTSSPFTFTLTNDGGQSVSGIVSLTGTYANQYQITSGGGNFTLSPNQTRDVTVVFSPISSGNKPANLHASGANAPDAGLSGNGVEIGHLTWSPTSYDFGTLTVGQTSSPYTFTLTNDGGQSVSGSISLTGSNPDQFTITSGGGSFTLSPNQNRDVTVVFSPTSSGNKSANLHSSGANAPDASLSGYGGEGHLTWSPTSHDFGTVTVGQTSDPFTFTLTNDSGQNISGIIQLSSSSPHINDFTITSGGGSFNLSSGQSIDVDVIFHPTAVGDREAWLEATGANEPLAQLVGFGTSPPASVNLTPYNPPITIPGSGGSFDFNIELINNQLFALNFDAWIMVTLPSGLPYGPVLGPVNLTLPGGGSTNRDRTQFVPSGAPAGLYTYEAYVGIYSINEIWSSDQFPFEKLAAGDGNWFEGWFCIGELFPGEILPNNEEPEEFALIVASPNPFNPETTFKFTLPDASEISLIIYDVQGKEVARLVDGWQPVGEYRITFDASKLSSGVYFAHLIAGDFHQTQKLLLIK